MYLERKGKENKLFDVSRAAYDDVCLWSWNNYY